MEKRENIRERAFDDAMMRVTHFYCARFLYTRTHLPIKERAQCRAFDKEFTPPKRFDAAEHMTRQLFRCFAPRPQPQRSHLNVHLKGYINAIGDTKDR